MKLKSLLLFLLGSSLFFTSCKKTEEAPDSTEQNTKTTTETPAANDVSNITTTPSPTATQTAAPAGQPPKLNPPHGQPFHKCEIAVGAPLDGSAPAQGTTPAPAQQNEPKSFFKTVQSEQQTTPAPTVASAPRPQATQITSKDKEGVVRDENSKTTITTTSNSNTPKPKNNPAHGQPHHRCDVKVGDPLPDA